MPNFESRSVYNKKISSKEYHELAMHRTVSMSSLPIPPTTISPVEDGSLVASAQSAPVTPTDSLTSLAALTLSPNLETPRCPTLSNRHATHLHPLIDELMTAVKNAYQSTQIFFQRLSLDTYQDASYAFQEPLCWFIQNETIYEIFRVPQGKISLHLKEIQDLIVRAEEQLDELDISWDDDSEILSETKKDEKVAPLRSVLDQLQAAMNKITNLVILPKQGKLATIADPISIKPMKIVDEEEKLLRFRLRSLDAKAKATYKTVKDTQGEIKEALSDIPKLASQQLTNKIELVERDINESENSFKMLHQACEAIPKETVKNNCRFDKILIAYNTAQDVMQQVVAYFQNNKRMIYEEINDACLADDEPKLKLTQKLLASLEIEFSMILDLLLNRQMDMSYFLKKAKQALSFTLDTIKEKLSDLSRDFHLDPELSMLDIQYVIVSVEIANSTIQNLSNDIKAIPSKILRGWGAYSKVLGQLYAARAHTLESDYILRVFKVEYPENVELTPDKQAKAKELLVELETVFTKALGALNIEAPSELVRWAPQRK